MKRFSARGFIQLPLLIALLGFGIAGAYTAAKLPQVLQEREYKKLSQQTTLPVGTASSQEILVGFRPGASIGQKDFAHQQARSGLKRRISQINVDAVKVPANSSVAETIARYQNLPTVEYVEPNFVATVFLTPNDPLFSQQWNLQKVLVEDAYDVSQGGLALIAIVDTGVDASHPDLSGLVNQGYNTISEDSNTIDDHGHGTLVAGIASAQTNNGSGVASISYQSTILPVKVLNSDGTGTYDDVSEGIIYAADNKAFVVNLSLGGSSDSQTLKRAVDYALGRGSILVAAAGNNGNDAPVYPASYPGVLAISASDQKDNLAGFSSYGSNVFAASPGVSITSTATNSNYTQASGTSMSAPHTAGLLAIALSANPELNNSQLIDHIKNNAEKVGPYAYDENGWNPYFGYGRISSAKTLQAIKEEAETIEPTPTPIPASEPISSNRLPAQAKVPAKYSFSFELQGKVESIDTNANKLTVKLDGGTPNVLELISGNLVETYLDSQTRIKYQGRNLSLGELNPDSRVNIKGNIVQNKLIALEILVQSMPKIIPTSPIEVPPGQDQNSGQESAPEENKNPVQQNLPAPAQQRFFRQ